MRRPDEGTAGRCARLPESWNFEDMSGGFWAIRWRRWDEPGKERVAVRLVKHEDGLTEKDARRVWVPEMYRIAERELEQQEDAREQSLYDSRNDEHLNWE
jgi:hypothetical protein